jgi:hypothetical protein
VSTDPGGRNGSPRNQRGCDQSHYYRKQSRIQFTGTLSAGQTRTYFTFNWPADEIVYWSMHPTTTNGRVNWTVDIRLADNGRLIYYLTVTNTGSVTTSFDAKYIAFR